MEPSERKRLHFARSFLLNNLLGYWIGLAIVYSVLVSENSVNGQSCKDFTYFSLQTNQFETETLCIKTAWLISLSILFTLAWSAVIVYFYVCLRSYSKEPLIAHNPYYDNL